MKSSVVLKNIIKSYSLPLLPAIGVFVLGLTIYFFPRAIFPDYFNLKVYSRIYELFNLIISSLTSLIGIYITVSLVAYEFFKQKSGIDFHKSFLINRVNAIFISFSVATIICAFVSSLLIHSENPNYHDVSIIYYNSVLFLLIIFLLFPVAFNLFSSLRPGKLASDELEKINNESIFIKGENEDDIDKQVEDMENDPLVKVQNIVIALISVSDKIKAQAIILKCTLKLGTLIINAKTDRGKKYITNRLINFYINIIDFSLLQPNNSAILNNIFLSIESMYSLLISRKENAHNFAAFREGFFERYFNRLLENNKEEIIFKGIETIRLIIRDQIACNMFPDNEIYDLNHLRAEIEEDFKYPEDFEKDAHEKSKHWTEMSMELLHCFSFLMNKAVKLNKPELLNKCTEELNKLNRSLNLGESGKYKQAFLYIRSATIISDYAYEAFKANVFNTGSDAKGLLPVIFDSDIEEEKLYSRSVLQKYCYLLIYLQDIDKLDRWFLGGLSINNFITLEGDLGELARRCSVNYSKNKNVQDCLIDIIETYKILKETYETGKIKRFDLYSAVKIRLETIAELLEKYATGTENLIKSINENVHSFKSLEEYEKLN